MRGYLILRLCYILNSMIRGTRFGAVRKSPQGYTIVEVMIFLAVTGLLFAMIALTFTGTRGRTQFQTAARDIESRTRDIINDTSTGYYYRTGDFSCQATVAGPVFSPGGAEQGSNQECIFIGRVLHFDVDDDPTEYHVYNVAALRRVYPDGPEVSNFQEAQPEPIFGGVAAAERLTLPNGAEAASIYYNSGGSVVPISAIGFLSSFARYDSGALQPGALSVNVVPLGDGVGKTEGHVAGFIRTLGNAPDPPVQNPDGGLVVCINSGTSDQHAVLKIGGEGSQLTTDLVIGNGQIAEGATCD